METKAFYHFSDLLRDFLKKKTPLKLKSSVFLYFFISNLKKKTTTWFFLFNILYSVSKKGCDGKEN